MQVEFNSAPVVARLQAARDLLGTGMLPVYQEMGEYLVESHRARFRKGVAPDGTKWRAKSKHTIARYLARGDGSRPDPLIGPSGRLGREIAMLAAAGQVEVGSALEYSGVMQRGAAKGAFGTDSRGRPLPWGDIPARVWLGLSTEDEGHLLDILDENLAARLGE